MSSNLNKLVINGPSGTIRILSLDEFVRGIPLQNISTTRVIVPKYTDVSKTVLNIYESNKPIEYIYIKKEEHTLNYIRDIKPARQKFTHSDINDFIKNELLTIVTKEKFHTVTKDLKLEEILKSNYELMKYDNISNLVFVNVVLNEYQKFSFLTDYDNWVFYFNEKLCENRDSYELSGKLICKNMGRSFISIRYQDNKLYEDMMPSVRYTQA